MKVNLKLNNLHLEIDFDFIEGEAETQDTPSTPESVYIYKIRLADQGWEQDCIPNNHIALIKEMLIERDYVEVITSHVTQDLFKMFNEDINPTK